MSGKLVGTMLTVVLLGPFGRSGNAQDFRIYTRVYDERKIDNDAAQRSKPTIVARSLSLFHAGKVYDYIESVGEVIVFEPMHRRFTILSTSREIATMIEFDELQQLLKIARLETEKYVAQLNNGATSSSEHIIAPLRFQLDPHFDKHFDPDKQRLKLTSRYFRYEALCAEVESPGNVDKYLRYADWIARLNYVLHPRALYPEPRLALNAALRGLKKMPVEVELRAEIESGIHLRAEHQIRWELGEKDRFLIRSWETKLKNKRTERVSFRDYQRTVLASKAP